VATRPGPSVTPFSPKPIAWMRPITSSSSRKRGAEVTRSKAPLRDALRMESGGLPGLKTALTMTLVSRTALIQDLGRAPACGTSHEPP
jgi:hypothetical protein